MTKNSKFYFDICYYICLGFTSLPLSHSSSTFLIFCYCFCTQDGFYIYTLVYILRLSLVSPSPLPVSPNISANCLSHYLQTFFFLDSVTFIAFTFPIIYSPFHVYKMLFKAYTKDHIAIKIIPDYLCRK